MCSGSEILSPYLSPKRISSLWLSESGKPPGGNAASTDMRRGMVTVGLLCIQQRHLCPCCSQGSDPVSLCRASQCSLSSSALLVLSAARARLQPGAALPSPGASVPSLTIQTLSETEPTGPRSVKSQSKVVPLTTQREVFERQRMNRSKGARKSL